MCPSAGDPTTPSSRSSDSDSLISRLSHLRGVRWRINLCNFQASSIDDLRRVTADSRRRYASLRRRLLVDPHIMKDGSSSPDLAMDNPLSENPDSMWGRFFRNVELEKLLDQDLSRLYPEHGSYFQTLGCQSILRRILLLWCLTHPEYGYGQGMHELLAPLLYVLHADLQRLAEVRNTHEDHFTDKFDDALLQENDQTYNFDFRRSSDFIESDVGFLEKAKKSVSLDELDPETQIIVLLSDAYGAEGELGVILSEKFMEHDLYCMFDSLMSGAGGAVAMADFFLLSTSSRSHAGISQAVEASSALYHLLSVVDSPLYSHLIELGVEPQYFALRWLRVLFGREFSLEDLLLIWDEIFSFDNFKAGTGAEDEPGSFSRVLNSRRGAFISSMAVSMMLNLRSALLAAETATSCLQRLLNFRVDLGKLIEEAKSLLPLALDVLTSPSYVASETYGKITTPAVRGHSLSFDSASSKISLVSVPERYWEDKWRDLHKEEELRKEKHPGKQTSSSKRSWTEKIKSRLYRTESDPPPSIYPSKRDGREERRSSLTRNLLEDLSQHLGENIKAIGEDISTENHKDPFQNESTVGLKDAQEDVACIERTFSSQHINIKAIGEDNSTENHKDPFQDESTVGLKDAQEDVVCIERTFSSQHIASVENTAIISNPVSLERESSPLMNDMEKISVESDVKAWHIGLVNSNTDNQHEISDQPDAGPSTKSASPELVAIGSSSKDRKSRSGKFQWFPLWKLGRHPSMDGHSDKINAPEVVKPTNEENQRSNMVVSVVQPDEERNLSHVRENGNVTKQNNVNLRSLGMSMLENIEVIESMFQNNSHEAASVNKAENSQVTAISALKELRKISNLLCEM